MVSDPVFAKTEKPAYKLDPEFVDESKRRPNSSTPKRTVRFLDDVGKEHQEVSGDRQFGDSSGFVSLLTSCSFRLIRRIYSQCVFFKTVLYSNMKINGSLLFAGTHLTSSQIINRVL